MRTRPPVAVALLATLVLLLAPLRAWAAALDPAFVESTFVASPWIGDVTSMAWAPDGSDRLFIARKDGEVDIVKNGVLMAASFVWVRPIYTDGECGLLGVAFDPDFLTNKYIYF